MKLLLLALSKPLFATGMLGGLMVYRTDAVHDLGAPGAEAGARIGPAVVEELVVPLEPEIAPAPEEAPAEPAEPAPDDDTDEAPER